jgi:RHS repeat-associated protein
MLWAKDRSTDGGGTLLALSTMTYDVFGNRLEEDDWTSSSGTTTSTRFGYDGSNAWADLDTSNNLLMRRYYLDSVDSVFARASSQGTVAWYMADRLGSVRDLYDNSGTRQDHITYDGYGNITAESNSTFGDRYKWTGREWDSVIGLQYNRARYYDSKIGRWTSQDPLGFDAGDSNLYRYVNDSPTNQIDSQGLFPQLRIEPQAVAAKGNFGAFAWPINWRLTEPAGKDGGYILQHIRVKLSIDYTGEPSSLMEDRIVSKDYWEAWRVEPGAVTVATRKGDISVEVRDAYKQMGVQVPVIRNGADDWYYLPWGKGKDGKESSGSVKVKGEAWYFAMKQGIHRRIVWIPWPTDPRVIPGSVVGACGSPFGSGPLAGLFTIVAGNAPYYRPLLLPDGFGNFRFVQDNPDTGAGHLYSINTGRGFKEVGGMFDRYILSIFPHSARVKHDLESSWTLDGKTTVKTDP